MYREAEPAAMHFISFAQNFEDVMLWRALKHVENGFYIDVGANDPVADSVTKAFYDRGWRGINVEPLPSHCDDLRAQRPRDITLCCAAGETRGETEIYDCEVRGWATGDKTVAERHAREGYQGGWRRVSMRTLTDICHEHVTGSIHFLKIDVEGMEKQVIDGADLKSFRPWIVVVEAALVHAKEKAHEPWEETLQTQGYRFAYCDGLNRFYVAEEHQDIMGSFRYPPNVTDGFIRAAQVNAEQRARHWETRARRAADKARREEGKVRALAQEQLAIFDSASWKVTAPLRAVFRGKRQLLAGGRKWLPSAPARWVLRLPFAAFRRFAGSHPKLKAFLLQILSLFPGLKDRLKYAGMVSRIPAGGRRLEGAEGLSPLARRFFVELEEAVVEPQERPE
jgi:FkbM family methyltransferase